LYSSYINEFVVNLQLNRAEAVIVGDVYIAVCCEGVHPDNIRRAILWFVWAARTCHILRQEF